ncbi:hypothetical protein GP486_005987 [Trichoglossum hirsutum]|uniref:Ankyrin repeat protein n=1 Tax=Trichoglossum hirsutum TaxID=265104 RepID=A0A9P8RLQ0_9PEZI|nr:hypothetical protein GP486_005987 [Trichoglossum hirsutum]
MVTYITTEIREREEDEWILEGKYPGLEEQLIEILCRRAGGMFRWVQLQLSLFLKPRVRFYRYETVKKHLKLLNTSSVAGEKDLNAAYDAMFDRNTADGGLEREHASKIYKILLCYKYPLSMDIITEAVAFNENNGLEGGGIGPPYIRRLAQDFIAETRWGKFEFAHVSVRDYLQGERQSDYSDAKCHAEAARTCLRFWGEHCTQLSKEDRQGLGVSETVLDWFVRISDSVPIFLHKVNCAIRPISAACVWNLIEAVEELLSGDRAYDLHLSLGDIGADAKDVYGRTPLSWAAIGGHEAVVRLLVERDDVKADSKDRRDRTPLSYSAEEGHEMVIQLLVDRGDIEADSRDKYGRTPLCFAAGQGSWEVVQLLIDRGDVEADSKDHFGRTSLSYAATRSYKAVAQLLEAKLSNKSIDDV